jgi:hypothetical protein
MAQMPNRATTMLEKHTATISNAQAVGQQINVRQRMKLNIATTAQIRTPLNEPAIIFPQ